jgi:hypothetical protein
MTSVPARSANLESQQRALNIIGDFAERMCTRIPLRGSGESLRISAEARADLNQVLRQLADLGAQIDVAHETNEYSSVLRSELAASVDKSNECRIRVLEGLKDRVLPPSPGATAPQADLFDDAQKVALGWHKAFVDGDHVYLASSSSLPFLRDGSLIRTRNDLHTFYDRTIRSGVVREDTHYNDIISSKPMHVQEFKQLYPEGKVNSFEKAEIKDKDFIVVLSMKNKKREGALYILVRQAGEYMHVAGIMDDP